MVIRFAHTQLPPSNLPAQPCTADSIATSSNATNSSAASSSAASSSAASSSTANSSSGPRESRRHSRPIRTLSYTGCGGEKGPVTFPAFKAGDSFLRGPNGGFDSHTPPPPLSIPRRRRFCVVANFPHASIRRITDAAQSQDACAKPYAQLRRGVQRRFRRHKNLLHPHHGAQIQVGNEIFVQAHRARGYRQLLPGA